MLILEIRHYDSFLGFYTVIKCHTDAHLEIGHYDSFLVFTPSSFQLLKRNQYKPVPLVKKLLELQSVFIQAGLQNHRLRSWEFLPRLEEMLRILSWDTWKEPSRIQGLWLNLQQSLVPIVSLICLVLRIPTIRPNQKLIFSGNLSNLNWTKIQKI